MEKGSHFCAKSYTKFISVSKKKPSKLDMVIFKRWSENHLTQDLNLFCFSCWVMEREWSLYFMILTMLYLLKWTGFPTENHRLGYWSIQSKFYPVERVNAKDLWNLHLKLLYITEINNMVHIIYRYKIVEEKKTSPEPGAYFLPILVLYYTNWSLTPIQ